MKLGIIGLPQSGKTTLFNALTRGNQPTSISGGRFDVHTAVVDVPDERVDILSQMFKPRKTTYAKVSYADIAGLDGSASKDGLSGQLLNQLSQMDGFIHVVRCFENVNIPHPRGKVSPQDDVESMDAEFILNDLIIVERKLERLAEERRKGGGRDRAVIDREVELFERLKSTLSSEQPIRGLDLTNEERKTISGFGFLTQKPVLIVLNLSDGQHAPEIRYTQPKSELVALQGKLEMELAQLRVDEAEVFMQEYGIEELSLSRIVRLSYDLLGLISFFTVGEDEVRAWTLRKGASALEAAGTVHTDLEKGFIRAEVIVFESLVELGGLSEARSKGKLRLEGKEYVVQDGEIVHIRFNI